MAAKVQEEKLIRDVHELLVTVEARVLPSELDRLLWLVRDQGYDLDIALQGMMLKRGDFNQIDLIHVALLSPGIMLMKPLDQAAWLINMKQFDVVPVADALHISTHAARIAAGATVAQPSVVETLPSAQPQPAFAPTHVAPQPTAHIGRPRTLHQDSEAELRKRIEDADKSGRPLTKNECLSIVRTDYVPSSLEVGNTSSPGFFYHYFLWPDDHLAQPCSLRILSCMH